MRAIKALRSPEVPEVPERRPCVPLAAAAILAAATTLIKLCNSVAAFTRAAASAFLSLVGGATTVTAGWLSVCVSMTLDVVCVSALVVERRGASVPVPISEDDVVVSSRFAAALS